LAAKKSHLKNFTPLEKPYMEFPKWHHLFLAGFLHHLKNWQQLKALSLTMHGLDSLKAGAIIFQGPSFLIMHPSPEN